WDPTVDDPIHTSSSSDSSELSSDFLDSTSDSSASPEAKKRRFTSPEKSASEEEEPAPHWHVDTKVQPIEFNELTDGSCLSAEVLSDSPSRTSFESSSDILAVWTSSEGPPAESGHSAPRTNSDVSFDAPEALLDFRYAVQHNPGLTFSRKHNITFDNVQGTHYTSMIPKCQPTSHSKERKFPCQFRSRGRSNLSTKGLKRREKKLKVERMKEAAREAKKQERQMREIENARKEEERRLEAKEKTKTTTKTTTRARLNGTVDINYDEGERKLGVKPELVHVLEDKRMAELVHVLEDKRMADLVQQRFAANHERNLTNDDAVDDDDDDEGFLDTFPVDDAECKVNSDGTVNVDFNDEDKDRYVDMKSAKLLDSGNISDASNSEMDSPSFSKGDKVECRYQRKSKCYAGTITKVHRDGTFDVSYDSPN
ncbi:hypothetical protein TrRE_jg11290, partial [Triparma retinervis]